MKLIIPHNLVPELKGHHAKSMFMLLALGLIGISCIAIPKIGFDATPSWRMAIPFFGCILLFPVLIFKRTQTASCNECGNRMEKQKRVLVIDSRKRLGNYNCLPWNLFHCPSCQKDWRIPAIQFGERPHRISEKEKEQIDQTIDLARLKSDNGATD